MGVTSTAAEGPKLAPPLSPHSPAAPIANNCDGVYAILARSSTENAAGTKQQDRDRSHHRAPGYLRETRRGGFRVMPYSCDISGCRGGPVISRRLDLALPDPLP